MTTEVDGSRQSDRLISDTNAPKGSDTQCATVKNASAMEGKVTQSGAQTDRGTATLGRSVRFLDSITSIAVIVAAVAVVWSVFGRQGATSMPAAPPVPAAPVTIDQASSIGSSAAKVVLVEFSDFQCPYCARFVRDTLPELRKRFIDTGKVQLAFRNLPLTNVHPKAMRAAEAAECAASQGRFAEMHDILFASQTKLEDEALRDYARQAGVDLSRFAACMDGEAAGKITGDTQAAKDMQLSSTPSFLVGRRNADGRVTVASVIVGAKPAAEFAKAIDQALARS